MPRRRLFLGLCNSTIRLFPLFRTHCQDIFSDLYFFISLRESSAERLISCKILSRAYPLKPIYVNESEIRSRFFRVNFFKCFFFGVPYLASNIFLLFVNEARLST